MKTIPVPSFKDTFSDSFNPRQVPETDFEKALMRSYIQKSTGDFKYSFTDAEGKLQFGRCSLNIGNEWDEDGRLRCSFSVEPSGEWSMDKIFSAPQFEIFFSIEEREYPASEAFRVIIAWEMSSQVSGVEIGSIIPTGQSNHWPYPPVIGLTANEVSLLNK